MSDIKRDDIYILNQHSDMSAKEMDISLKKYVYADENVWKKFLRLFFIALGISFTVLGIIFFFAYNWNDLNKFAKLGITQVLLVVTTIVALIPKTSQLIKNIVLTGAAFLVGVLFAVFGQIYQTGANAYDFFLAWTFFITIWVFISNYAPLWLLYIALINTSLFFYSEQIADDWAFSFLIILLICNNLLFYVGALLLSNFKKLAIVPNYLLYILALAIVVLATIGISIGIFEYVDNLFYVLLCFTLILYAGGLWHSLRSKNSFYISIISFSLIIIISSLLIDYSENEGMFLVIGLFIIASITLTIKGLLDLNKKWNNG